MRQYAERLQAIAGDVDGRYRCPRCKGETFQDADKESDAAELQIRKTGAGWQVREPAGGSTTYAKLWRAAPRGLICLGECHDQPQDHWSIFDTEDDGRMNLELL